MPTHISICIFWPQMKILSYDYAWNYYHNNTILVYKYIYVLLRIAGTHYPQHHDFYVDKYVCKYIHRERENNFIPRINRVNDGSMYIECAYVEKHWYKTKMKHKQFIDYELKNSMCTCTSIAILKTWKWFRELADKSSKHRQKSRNYHKILQRFFILCLYVETFAPILKPRNVLPKIVLKMGGGRKCKHIVGNIDKSFGRCQHDDC